MLVNYHGPAAIRTQNNQNHGNTPTVPPTESPNIPSDIGAHTFTQSKANSNTNAGTPVSVPGTGGATHDTVTCFNCHASGHYANVCPSAVLLLQYAYTLTQNADGTPGTVSTISKDWILLDSQSSISVFNNLAMLTNIRTSPQPLTVSLVISAI
jgi:hypothetical protein